MRQGYAGWVLAATLAMTGCGGASVAQLRNRAALDLGCKADQVSLQQVDGSTQSAVGCGKRITYVEVCTPRPYPGTVSCTWVANTERSLGSSDGQHSGSAVETQAAGASAAPVAELEVRGSSGGEKELRLHLGAKGWDAYIRAQPSKDMKVATLVIRMPNAPDCQIKLVADGTRLALTGETEKTGASDHYTQYRTGLPYDSLVAMARGTRVLGRVCDSELALEPTHIAKLAELVMRIQEELAWDEAPAPASEPAQGEAPTEL